MKTAELNFSNADGNPDAKRRGTRVWKQLSEAAFFTILFFFSFFLMFHTFSYDGAKHEMHIASKAWSDFGAHIPLIRSFSYGPNYSRLMNGDPIESPLFPGEPIRYHFGFYAFAGLLERLGIRMDWALNVPSALGFFALLILLYGMSFRLFQNAGVSLLTVIFFLFNGSLSGLRFFREHPLSPATPLDIITNTRFPAFGPWDGGDITAFWTLNIYTNQRHLGLSYALLLGILLALHTPMKKAWHTACLVGMLASLLLFVNFAVAGISILFLGWIFLIQKKMRASLIISALVALPAVFLVRHMSNTVSAIAWQPGYLMQNAGDNISFIRFWVANLGLHAILIPLGLIWSPKPIRRLLGAPLILLFILPNLFRFSPDMINNHKFFNFFLILGNMFSAYAVIRIGHIRHIGLICLINLIFFSTLSGFIDFFPIINDTKGSVPDSRKNPDTLFFLTQSKPTDIIANSTWFYHPASLAGRSLFSGYTYFTWSYGYDQTSREAVLKAIYSARDTQILCTLLTQNNIAFVELSEKPESYLQPNWTLWQGLILAYENPKSHLKIYSIHDICSVIQR